MFLNKNWIYILIITAFEIDFQILEVPKPQRARSIGFLFLTLLIENYTYILLRLKFEEFSLLKNL